MLEFLLHIMPFRILTQVIFSSFAQYTYITYLGFNGWYYNFSIGPQLPLPRILTVSNLGSLTALPFLVRSRLMLFPLLPFLISYVVSLLGFNISRYVLALYFE